MNIAKDLETPEQTFHLSTLQSIHPIHGVSTNSSNNNGNNSNNKYRGSSSQSGNTPLRRSDTRTYGLASDSSDDDNNNNDHFNDDDDDRNDQDNDDDLLDKERFVSFSFSGSRRGWDQFTAFVMADSGLVYRLCPVVPEGCVVPHSLLSFLHQGIEQLPSKLSSYAQSIKQWLTEIKGQKLRGPKTGALDSSNDKKPSRSAAFKRSKEFDAPTSDSSEVWYRTCAPSTLRSKALALQGPLNLCTSLIVCTRLV